MYPAQRHWEHHGILESDAAPTLLSNRVSALAGSSGGDRGDAVVALEATTLAGRKLVTYFRLGAQAYAQRGASVLAKAADPPGHTQIRPGTG
jgi:hypothetical protein